MFAIWVRESKSVEEDGGKYTGLSETWEPKRRVWQTHGRNNNFMESQLTEMIGHMEDDRSYQAAL